MNLERYKVCQIIPMLSGDWIVNQTRVSGVFDDFFTGELSLLVDAYMDDYGSLKFIDLKNLLDFEKYFNLSKPKSSMWKYLNERPFFIIGKGENLSDKTIAFEQWDCRAEQMKQFLYNECYERKRFSNISYKDWCELVFGDCRDVMCDNN